MHSAAKEKEVGIKNEFGLPQPFDPEESEPSPGKVFIILKGSFSF